MSLDFHVIIPARHQSSRLPGKLMMELNGLTVIERVYRQALKAKPKSVTIATDHAEIFSLAKSFKASVEMTKTTHQSGTDRIAEVVARGAFQENDIIVNVQGDEPFIAPELITQVAHTLAKSDTPMATLCWPIEQMTARDNPNVVKVVRDKHQNALYFSRSPIPANRDHPNDLSLHYRHIGLYAYRASFLLELVQQPVCPLEAAEALEQLRVLWLGYPIKVATACTKPLQDINTAEDLDLAKKLVNQF
ncbi:3-deoxy-manno-octulosonate cytidylyltransferase [Legionella impletisoli]|uniref:3-deoxy-manno-octulosonate cytidylyltransferase n=1 Tax=Legionella impletisoli TaxID=343510 RepID=A0A917JUT7_9GAMM|nr:3-deoxy-manno-octulosonate cytidylyltransferase [Legionella impletisoli]GGI85574.1 3-deoxy-manno-octulosonate cytidylyltransferase [Legionella impletisoli]